MTTGDRTLSYPTGDGAVETPFSAPYLVLAIDCGRPRRLPARLSLAEVDRVELGRADARRHRRHAVDGVPTLTVELDDRHLSSKHASIESRGPGRWLVDLGSKNGCYLNGSRVSDAPLTDGDLIEIGNTVLLYRTDVDRLPSEPADVEITGSEPMATLSPALGRVMARAARCASSELPILITGPSGTGKEVASRWIHRLSGRKGQLVAINCGALPENLIESELFGVKKGAFSGADRDRPGLIRAASGGTLFLDEIAELPPPAQVKLLRVLQEKEVTAIGDTRAEKVDVRIVSATLQDVDAAVTGGRLRADLLARLDGFRLELPALAERREDIGLLIGRVLGRFEGGEVAQLSRGAARALLSYEWPLNIRELEQTLGAALALATNRVIRREHLPEAIAGAGEPSPPPEADFDPADEALQSELVALLRRHKGNVSAVARDMDRARIQVRRWCKRLGIDVKSFR